MTSFPSDRLLEPQQALNKRPQSHLTKQVATSGDAVEGKLPRQSQVLSPDLEFGLLRFVEGICSSGKLS